MSAVLLTNSNNSQIFLKTSNLVLGPGKIKRYWNYLKKHLVFFERDYHKAIYMFFARGGNADSTGVRAGSTRSHSPCGSRAADNFFVNRKFKLHPRGSTSAVPPLVIHSECEISNKYTTIFFWSWITYKIIQIMNYLWNNPLLILLIQQKIQKYYHLWWKVDRPSFVQQDGQHENRNEIDSNI